MNTTENWLYIISGFTTAWAIATVLYGLRHIRQSGAAYKATSQLHQITNAIIHKTSADRAIVVKVENGGKSKFITVLIDSHTKNVGSIIKTFQRIPADKGYMQMLEELLDNKLVVITTKDLKDSDLLKRVYHSQKITGATVFLLHEEKNRGLLHGLLYAGARVFARTYLFRRIYYISISTTDERLAIMGDEEFTYIEGMASNARNIMEEASDKKLI